MVKKNQSCSFLILELVIPSVTRDAKGENDSSMNHDFIFIPSFYYYYDSFIHYYSISEYKYVVQVSKLLKRLAATPGGLYFC